MQKLTNLKILKLTGMKVSDLTPLEELPNLEHLYVDNVEVLDLKSMGSKRENNKGRVMPPME